MGGPLSIRGAFISYAQKDASEFALQLHDKLYTDNLSVWLDKHDMVSGDVSKQVDRAIRLQDVVILVLSEAALESDWVEYELDRARAKEREEGRDVLCPVAIDDAWKYIWFRRPID